MSAALALPEVVTAVVKSFFNEDLHRFLTENQLGSVIESFPETFCSKDDAIFKYFKKTKGVVMVRETLCDLNIDALMKDGEQEFLNNMIMMQSKMNMSAHFEAIMEKAGCIIDTALVIKWEPLLNAIIRQQDIVGLPVAFMRYGGPDKW